jgi:hypothetical protein
MENTTNYPTYKDLQISANKIVEWDTRDAWELLKLVRETQELIDQYNESLARPLHDIELGDLIDVTNLPSAPYPDSIDTHGIWAFDQTGNRMESLLNGHWTVESPEQWLSDEWARLGLDNDEENGYEFREDSGRVKLYDSTNNMWVSVLPLIEALRGLPDGASWNECVDAVGKMEYTEAPPEGWSGCEN